MKIGGNHGSKPHKSLFIQSRWEFCLAGTKVSQLSGSIYLYKPYTQSYPPIKSLSRF